MKSRIIRGGGETGEDEAQTAKHKTSLWRSG